MASSLVFLLLQLLLISLASASHYYGGHVRVIYKGQKPDGTRVVVLRSKDTFHSCAYYYNLYWYCYSGNCGSRRSIQRGQIDHSHNGSPTRSTWCETAEVERIHIPTDKPFEI
ncbi:hypothetical protein LDENG_00280620, partial [Lucifuga dentata]